MTFIQPFLSVGLDPKVDITAAEAPVSTLGSMSGEMSLI
jgi:hypothetical protein